LVAQFLFASVVSHGQSAVGTILVHECVPKGHICPKTQGELLEQAENIIDADIRHGTLTAMHANEQTPETTTLLQAPAPVDAEAAMDAPTAGEMPDMHDVESANAFLARLETEPEPETEQAPEESTPTAEAEPEEAPSNDPRNYRLAAADELDQQAFALHKAGKGKIPMAKIMEMLRGTTAPAPGDSESAADTNATPAESTGSTLQSLNAKKATLEQELRDAHSAMDFEKASEIQIALVDLGYERLKAEQAEVESQKTAQTEALQKQTEAFNASLAKAAAHYPDSAVEGSALWHEMAAIDAALEAQGNPLFSEPDKAYKIAMMAANNLGIAPRMNAPVPAAKPAAVRPRPLAGGMSTQGAAAPPPSMDRIKSAYEMDEFLAAL
jgi:hypothetical protein